VKRPLLLGILLLVLFPAAANGELLAGSEAEGETPTATLRNVVLDPTAPLRLVANSSPGWPLAVTFRLDCYRGVAHRGKEYKLPRRAPFNRRIRFPIRNPISCYIYARASFDDGLGEDGWIVMKLYGRAALTAPLE
jgi:hypothetical protein